MPPGLVRKLSILATADGLVLQAQGNSQRLISGGNVESSVRIDYKTNKITSGLSPTEEEDDDDDKLEAYGIAGKICRW